MRFHIWREVANHALLHISTVLKRLFYFYARTEGKVKRYLRKIEEQNNVLNLAWFFFSVFKAEEKIAPMHERLSKFHKEFMDKYKDDKEN